MDSHRPALPSQRYPPHVSDYPSYEHRHHDIASGGRQPLQDTTGNSQNRYNYSCLVSCANSDVSLSIPPVLTNPPVVPTQAFGSSHYGPSSSLRYRRHQLQLQRRQKDGINPIYLSPQFQTYRKKQADRDEKADQKWPDLLEDAFLDALLLIPQMGRRKYTMNGQQHGRNMLISEYLWTAYCLSLPPGVEPDRLKMRRERKQVSSHIQVLKNFFTHHRCYHFFFPCREKKGDRLRDTVETESFKNNPVLIALSEGRLPDERPNYEYFAALLASDALVTVRPKKCWIYVSCAKVKIEENGTAFHARDGKLDSKLFPHLDRNSKNKDKMPPSGRFPILHEYTESMSQRESSSVRDISQDWQDHFPALYDLLDAAIPDTRSAPDILHMHVTLELQAPSHFPGGSELNSWVEVTIAQPALQKHRWKVATTLARPPELCGDAGDDPELYEQTSEIGVQYQHRPGCDALGFDCDCAQTRRKQDVIIPFPAKAWASTLSNCAHYRAHPSDGAKVKRECRDDDDARKNGAEPTQMDLVRQISMFQELWSSPPEASGNASWTRRAVVLWTFETIHTFNEKRQIVKQSPGSTWRFLTAIDPASQYHQQQALLSNKASSKGQLQRDAVMSPSPDYQSQLNASMTENFNSAWEATLALPTQQHHPHLGRSPLSTVGSVHSVLDGLPRGFPTPPPTASLPSSYSHSFDGSHDLNNGMRPNLGFLSTSSNGAATASTTSPVDSITDSSLDSYTDPFLAAANGHLHVAGMGGGSTNLGALGLYDEADDGTATALQDWEGGAAAGLDAAPWSGFAAGGPVHGYDGWTADGLLGKTTMSPPPPQAHVWSLPRTADEKVDLTGGSGGVLWSPTQGLDDKNEAVWGGLKDAGWLQAMAAPGAGDADRQWGEVGMAMKTEQAEEQAEEEQAACPPVTPVTPVTSSAPCLVKGVKRSRTDSLEDGRAYPLSTVPKLAHVAHVAPTAVMEGEGHDLSDWEIIGDGARG